MLLMAMVLEGYEQYTVESEVLARHWKNLSRSDQKRHSHKQAYIWLLVPNTDYCQCDGHFVRIEGFLTAII